MKQKQLSKTSQSIKEPRLHLNPDHLWPGPSWTRRSPPWSDSPAVYTPGYGNPVANTSFWQFLTPCCSFWDISFACHGPGWIQLWQVPSPALQPPHSVKAMSSSHFTGNSYLIKQNSSPKSSLSKIQDCIGLPQINTLQDPCGCLSNVTE